MIDIDDLVHEAFEHAGKTDFRRVAVDLVRLTLQKASDACHAVAVKPDTDDWYSAGARDCERAVDALWPK